MDVRNWRGLVFFNKNSCFFHEIMVPSCRVRNAIACCGGIWIDQWLLGIDEVWYFSSKQLFFYEMMVSTCCVMNSIACCAPHKTHKSLFVCLLVCPSQSETSFVILRFFEVLNELY